MERCGIREAGLGWLAEDRQGAGPRKRDERKK